MGPLKRLSKSLAVKIELLLDQVENHGASIAATIQEIEEASLGVRARHKAQLRRITELESRILRLREEHTRWEQRARRSLNDESVALECLGRKRRAMEEVTKLEATLIEEQKLEARLYDDLSILDEKLRGLAHRKAVLLSREARAGAAGLTSGHGVESVEVMLDRWEARIERAEVGVESMVEPVDLLDKTFTTEEAQASLKEELERLRREQPLGTGPSSDQGA